MRGGCCSIDRSMSALSGLTIFASTELTQSNPDVVRRFLKAWLEWIAFMKTHKDETVSVAAKIMATTPSIAARTYDSLISQFYDHGKFEGSNRDAQAILRGS